MPQMLEPATNEWLDANVFPKLSDFGVDPATWEWIKSEIADPGSGQPLPANPMIAAPTCPSEQPGHQKPRTGPPPYGLAV
jgi:hypothetical protein